MDYPKKTLTRDGAALLANDDADGYNTIIDYVITSDELPDSSEELDDIEVGDFHNPQKIKISSYQHQGATFQPEATWDNAVQTIKNEYPIQMFGLLAHGTNDNDSDETLLAVAVANGSPFIMPATDKVPFTFTMALTLTYSNANNVTADVDNTNAVTNEQLINTLKNKDTDNSKTYETIVNADSAISSLAKTDSSLKADITNLSTSASATFETSASANSDHNSLSSSINTLSNSDNNAHDSILAKAAALHNSLQANIDDVNKTTHRELGGFETMPAANQAHHSLEAELQSLNNNVGNGASASASSLSTQANNLQNQINQKPNWADVNWTRNNVAPSLANSAATNALNQANAHTDNQVNSLNSQLFQTNEQYQGDIPTLDLDLLTTPGNYDIGNKNVIHGPKDIGGIPNWGHVNVSYAIGPHNGELIQTIYYLYGSFTENDSVGTISYRFSNNNNITWKQWNTLASENYVEDMTKPNLISDKYNNFSVSSNFSFDYCSFPVIVNEHYFICAQTLSGSPMWLFFKNNPIKVNGYWLNGANVIEFTAPATETLTLSLGANGNGHKGYVWATQSNHFIDYSTAENNRQVLKSEINTIK